MVMDDSRTQQALDELADLFLSGQTPTPAPPQPTKDSPTDPLAGPAPIRLGPKLRGAPAKPRQSPPAPIREAEPPLRLHTEPDDSPLASIGEAREDAETPVETVPLDDEATGSKVAPDAPGHAVAVEAVILGNLPGLSGPWLTQYAQLLAQQEGPVAILHVDDDLIDLELVEPTDRGSAGRGVSLRMSPGGGQIDPVTVLEALLDSPDTAPGTILVHLDPQNDAHGLARALMIEDWTLMCGADDLAVVGGYRMLKTMVEDEPAVARKHVGLMIMGSDPKVSQDAASKFQSAAENFLNTPVQLLGWQKQMVPVNLRHLGRFEDVGSAWPRLAEWFDHYAATDPQPIDEPVIPDQPAETPASHPTHITQAPVEPEPVIEAAPQVPEPTQHTPEPPRFAPRPRREAPAPPVVPPVAPITAQAPVEQETVRPTNPVPVAPPAAPVSTPPVSVPPVSAPQVELEIEEPNLVELLMAGPGSVPGGIAMEARCPHQPKTQLMLDQAGRLHLLHRHDAQTDGLDGLQPAMIDLLQARKWVREHLSLLALTQRQLKFDADTEPVLHLFTDRADLATALAIRLGEALKLHLLQEVQLGDQQAWFCTPLN
jgi:hypothetical protein